jgi:hypothetical protein
VQDGAEQAEEDNTLSVFALTSREMRLLQLMARACARYAGTIFSAIASEQLEEIAWKVIKKEARFRSQLTVSANLWR